MGLNGFARDEGNITARDVWWSSSYKSSK